MNAAETKSNKYRKVLFVTNDRQYPYLFLRADGIYSLICADNRFSGDGFYSQEDVLKHFPKTDFN